MTSTSRKGSENGSVLSLGSINADFQVRVGRRPEISETLLGEDFARLGGGKAANVAYFARQLGVDARLFGHVGEDDLAEQALASLRDKGVDLDNVKLVAGMGTGVAMITVPPDGQKGIVLAPNANEAWTAEDASRVADIMSQMPGDSVLVIDCEIPAHVLEQTLGVARRRGFTIILDPSPADRVTDTLIGAIDFIAPNAAEAEQLTGIKCRDAKGAAEAGARLIERGVAVACVKLPEGGCVLVEKNRRTRIGVVPVEVIDSTGAGDAFAGALAVALLEKRSCVDAVRWAVAASHLAVTGYGSRGALPTRDQLQQMANRLESHTDAL